MDLRTVHVHPEDFADVIDPPYYRDNTKHHVTSLIRVAKSGEMPTPMPDEIKDKGILALGRVWEYVARAYVQKALHTPEFEDLVGSADLELLPSPGPIERDEVLGNLDGILVHGDKLSTEYGVPIAVAEIKLRYTLREEDPRDNWEQMHQIRAYCHMWNSGTLEALMVKGHVANSPPGFRVDLHYLTFTEREIAETWQMIMNAKTFVEARQ
jgi:hypothetical protein